MPARGVLGPLPLIRVRDMVVPRLEPGETSLGPNQRLLQRGQQAVELLVTQMLEGFTGKKGDRFLFVDLTPSISSEAALAMLNLQSQGFMDLQIGYVGLHTNKEELDFCARQVSLALMTSWWDKQPESGPKERPSDSGGIPRPQLKLCYYDGGVPRVLASTLGRFDGTEQEKSWKALVDNHNDKYRLSVAADGAAVAGAAAAVTVAGHGPTWDYPGLAVKDLWGERVELAIEPVNREALGAPVIAAPEKKKQLGVYLAPSDGGGKVFLCAASDGDQAAQAALFLFTTCFPIASFPLVILSFLPRRSAALTPGTSRKVSLCQVAASPGW